MKKIILLLFLLFMFMSCCSTKIYENKIDNYNEEMTYRETQIKKITAKNTLDVPLISYNIIGKPIVIVGTATANIIKCFTYSISTTFRVWWYVASGNNKRFNGDSSAYYWLFFPDSGKAKNKMILAIKEAEIEYPEYKEYRKCFCKSHLTVEDILSRTKQEETFIISYDKREFDNTIYLSKDIKKDFWKTVYVSNYAGYIISMPITFVGGCVGYIIGYNTKFH